jgi:uncharacterized membrane protein YfcA
MGSVAIGGMDVALWQAALIALAAFTIGFSKTGVPGTGIIVVPMMATALGAWLSIGATLPMLIIADVFAVAFYRAHAQWDRLRVLVPYVAVGLLLGAGFLLLLGNVPGAQIILNRLVGGIVLLMLGLSLVRGPLAEKLSPTSPAGITATGAVAGFTTMTSNAAGPVMAIYLAAAKLPKEQLMGTTAWFFFLINVAKVPFLVALTAHDSKHPLFTPDTLLMNAVLAPIIVVGAFAGRALLPHIPRRAFTNTVLTLAFLGGLKLLLLP